MSVPVGKLPAQISPLGAQGQSLDVRTVSCSGGVMSNIDDYLRPNNKVKSMVNFHQYTRGVFSSGGGGWIRDNQNGLNGGVVSTLDFGKYLDALNNQYLMVQVGNTLYSYDTVAHNPVQITTGLNPTALPCMRPASPTTVTTNPFTIYCNGKQEPSKIYNATAGAAPNTVATLGFTSGFNTQTISVGQQVTPNAAVKFFIFSAALSASPVGISYTPVASDTQVTVAANLAAAINSNATLSAALFTATCNGSVVTLSYPSTATVVLSYGFAAQSVKITAAVSNGIVFSITAAGTTVSYTANGADTANTVAQNLASVFNQNATIAALGIVANFSILGAPFITLTYPSQTAPSITVNANCSIVACNIETITIGGTPAAGSSCNVTYTINGTPYTTTYTQVAGDTLTSVAVATAASLDTGTNGSGPATQTYGFYGFSSGNLVIVTWPSNAPATTFGSGNLGGVTQTFAANASATATTLTFANGANNGTWPGVFNGTTYTKPALCSPFQSRVAYTAFANTGASGNAVCQLLLISSLGNAEQFTQSTPTRATDAWTIPIPAICGAPTALRSLKLNTNNASEVLIIGCQNGMCIVTGTDATTYNLQIHSTAYGIPSNRAFAQLDNALIFMASDGFRVYTGENNDSNLLTDTISLDIYDQFMQIDRTNWQKAHCIHHKDTQEIWFWVPYLTDNGICQHAFIYQYNTIDGQPIWYFVNNTSCQASVEFNSTFYGGNEVGVVQKWYGVNNYDDVSGNIAQDTITIGGATSNGATISSIFTGGALVGSPVTATYTQTGTDTTSTAASGLAAVINTTTALTNAGISAVASGAVITVSYPLVLPVVLSSARSGGFTITVSSNNAELVTVGGTMAFGNTAAVTFTSGSISGSPVTKTYTLQNNESVTTVAQALANLINADVNLSAASVTATANTLGNGIVAITYPLATSIVFSQSTSGGTTLALGSGYFISNTTVANAANILPGAQIIFPLVGVGNPGQFCSIRQVIIGTGNANQKFLMNAAAYEVMDNGSTRKQQQNPINFTVKSTVPGQTVLGIASPVEWTVGFSAFPQQNSAFLGDYVPQGHGREWEFSITCNDSSHNADITFLQTLISMGGIRV